MPTEDRIRRVASAVALTVCILEAVVVLPASFEMGTGNGIGVAVLVLIVLPVLMVLVGGIVDLSLRSLRDWLNG